jgi:hypothetical protein
MDDTEYSKDTKAEIRGALKTRVTSLTDGINGLVLNSAIEIDNGTLFDENTIVDLSKIGSDDTRALIMGVLIMKLGEYRSSSASGVNLDLKHVTVLEEAHNILKCVPKAQSAEGSNVVGQSVEMICNSIAEMRTYGEGFMIVDQSPSSVDIAAIKNTNTKIVMNLPLEDDYLIVGKSIALNEEQITEIPRLAQGIAVIKQNSWTMSIMVKVDKSNQSYEVDNSALQSDEVDENIKKAVFPFIREVLVQIETYRDGLENGLTPCFNDIAVKKVLRNFNVADFKAKDLLLYYESVKPMVTRGLWNKTQEDLFVLDIIGCRGLSRVFEKLFEECHIPKTGEWNRAKWNRKVYEALGDYVRLENDKDKQNVANSIIRIGDKIDKIKVYGEYYRWATTKDKK